MHLTNLIFHTTAISFSAKRDNPSRSTRFQLIVFCQNLSDYKPANPAYGLDKVGAAQSAMQSAQQAEVNAQNALDSARDAANQAEWAFHNAMLGVKEQVVAQYGDDSDALQSLGLTPALSLSK
ncbi:MAG TPA: hypothetical protein VIN60_03820 [Anaerolineales bacterium]